jgi:hypothetical protein
MPAIRSHSTSVVDVPWDANANVSKINTPVTGSVAQGEWAWYDGGGPDPDGDGWPDTKGSYKFPHHEVSADGKPGAANINGVRNGLARLSQASIPSGDMAGVRSHLERHLNDYHGSDSNAQAELIYGQYEEEPAWRL